MYCATKAREIETRKGGRNVVDWRKPKKQTQKVGFFPRVVFFHFSVLEIINKHLSQLEINEMK